MSPTSWIVLLLALAALGVFAWLRRTARAPPPARPPTPPGDELGALGLSAVRPATAPRIETSPDPVAAARSKPAASVSRQPAASVSRQPDAPVSTVSEARPMASPPDDAFVRGDSPLWAGNAEAVRHLLRSLAVALGGGVAVLRHEDDAYAIDALVGVPGVRSPRPLRADDHPLHRVPQDTVLSILGPESRRTLRYYAEPEAAVGQAVARALAEPPARRVLLVADVPPEHDALDDDALELIARYGDLLATMTDLEAPASASDEEEVPDADASELATEPEEAPASATDDDSDADDSADDGQDADEVLPRAVVIQNQMDAAQRDACPLAFALVTLAAADAVLRDDPERVAAAEARLRERLAGDAVRAVEPFGDLMLGVFLEGTSDEARAWAGALSDTEPPLLIGLVPAAEGDPEAIRAAATGALEEAYHQGGGVAVASA